METRIAIHRNHSYHRAGDAPVLFCLLLRRERGGKERPRHKSTRGRDLQLSQGRGERSSPRPDEGKHRRPVSLAPTVAECLSTKSSSGG